MPNGKVGGRAGSLLVIETAEMSLGSQKSKVGCGVMRHFHVYLSSNRVEQPTPLHSRNMQAEH